MQQNLEGILETGESFGLCFVLQFTLICNRQNFSCKKKKCVRAIRMETVTGSSIVWI